jgi:hypothetical protein
MPPMKALPSFGSRTPMDLTIVCRTLTPWPPSRPLPRAAAPQQPAAHHRICHARAAAHAARTVRVRVRGRPGRV